MIKMNSLIKNVPIAIITVEFFFYSIKIRMCQMFFFVCICLVYATHKLLSTLLTTDKKLVANP